MYKNYYSKHLIFMFFINGFLCVLVRNIFEMKNVINKFKMGREMKRKGNDITIVVHLPDFS